MANRLIQLKGGSDNLYPAGYTKNVAMTAADCDNIQTPANIDVNVAYTGGNICTIYITGGCVAGSTSANAWSTLFTIPTPPTKLIYFNVAYSTGFKMCRITTAGKVEVYSPVAGESYWGNVTFVF